MVGVTLHQQAPTVGVTLHQQAPTVGVTLHPQASTVGVTLHPQASTIGVTLHPQAPTVGLILHAQAWRWSPNTSCCCWLYQCSSGKIVIIMDYQMFSHFEGYTSKSFSGF